MNSATSKQNPSFTVIDIRRRPARFERASLIQSIVSSLVFLPAVLLAQPGPQPIRTDYNMQEVAQPPHLSNAEVTGRRLFVQYCSLCHDPVGQPTGITFGPALNSELLKSLGDDTARNFILKGSLRMPGFQYQLRTTDVDHILAFLRTYSVAGSLAVDSGMERQSKTLTEGTTGLLDGDVKAATGEPLRGVAVSARAAGRTVTTTVFTDDAGRYVFPALVQGTYKVWAQAEGYRAAQSTVNLLAAAKGRVPLEVTKFTRSEDVLPQLSSGEQLDSLPSRTPEERRMKEIFRLNCEECHAASIPLQRRFDEKGWAAIIEFMEQLNYDGWHGPPDPAHPDFGETGAILHMIHHYAPELAKYLATVRGPESPPLPLQLKLVPRPTGAAAKVVITGYDVPTSHTPNELSWDNGTIWSEGAASGMHSAVGVHDIIIDLQGNVWVTQTFLSSLSDVRQILKINTASGQVSAFIFPKTDRSENLAQRTHGMALDSKGNVWFGFDQTLAMITPATDTFQVFTPPAQLIDHMGNLTTDADAKDKIWTEGVPGIMRFDPETRMFSYYENQHPGPTFFFTYGVTGDAVGNGWWTVPDKNLVETVDVRTGKTTEILMRPPWVAEEEAVMTPGDRAFHVSIGDGLEWGVYKPGFQYPRRLAADKSGTAVWVPNYWGRNLARIDIVSKQITYYKLPVNAHPYFAKVDKNHVVWMNFESDDRVMSFDPRSQEWTLYRLPINGCESRNLALDNRTGDVWVPCYRASKVFRLQFRETQ